MIPSSATPGVPGDPASARINFFSMTWYWNKTRLRSWDHFPVLVLEIGGKDLGVKKGMKGWAGWIPKSEGKMEVPRNGSLWCRSFSQILLHFHFSTFLCYTFRSLSTTAHVSPCIQVRHTEFQFAGNSCGPGHGTLVHRLEARGVDHQLDCQCSQTLLFRSGPRLYSPTALDSAYAPDTQTRNNEHDCNVEGRHAPTFPDQAAIFGTMTQAIFGSLTQANARILFDSDADEHVTE